MQQMLAKTSSDKRHDHLVYLTPMSQDPQTGETVGGIGSTSVKRKHTHEIIQDPETQEWIVGEADGHTHEVQDYVPKTTKIKELDEDKKVRNVHHLFKEEVALERKSREDGEESEGFYSGEGQWEEGVREALRAEKRTAITINETAAKVNLLTGFQRQNRTDLRFAPVEGGDVEVAKVMDKLVKNIFDQNDMPHEESSVFRDQVIAGRGIFDVYVDYDQDIEGKIVIEKFPWKDIYIGPHEKRDFSDLEHLTKSKMFSRAKIKQMYPDNADDIDRMFDEAEAELTGSPIRDNPGDQYATGTQMLGSNFAGSPLVDTAKKEVRVFEQFEKEYHTEYVITRFDDGFVEPIRDMTKAEAKEWETIEGIATVRRNVFDIKVTVVAGSVLLDEEVEEDFPVCVAYAQKMGNEFWGKVHEVKDPQREVNKRHSQAIDILNKQAAYNWIYDEQTFKDIRDEKEFLANTSTPGYAVKVQDIRNAPQKTEGSRVPSEVVGLMDLASQKIREIMNIPMEASGFTDKEFSGIALQEKRRQTLTANEYLFDNLDSAKRSVAKRVIKLAQQLYTPERIMRIIGNMNPATEEEMMELQIQQQAVMTFLSTPDILKHDVVSFPSPESPTIRMANFAVLMQMASTMPDAIPPEILIDASDIRDKEKILGQLQARAQAAAQAEQAKMQNELLKSLPDEMQAQMLGGPAQGGPPQDAGQV